MKNKKDNLYLYSKINSNAYKNIMIFIPRYIFLV